MKEAEPKISEINDNSSSNYKKKLMQQKKNSYERMMLKASISSLSNMICMDNLIRKKSVFAPSRLETIKSNKPNNSCDFGNRVPD